MGPAKFRGVEFFVESADRSGGRRVVKHEYPLRDLPYGEDMGRKARSFPVEGYVIGDDYLVAKNALIDALEKPGPGELNHPYYGTLRVIVEDYRVRETSDRGGTATFSITFFETPAQPTMPAAVVDAAAKVASSAAAARTAVGAEFLATYSPGLLLDSVGNSLRSAMLAVNNTLATLAIPAQQAATLHARVDALTGSVATLVNEPSRILEGLSGVFELFDSGSALAKIYRYEPGPRPPGTTPTRVQEQASFDATYRLNQRLAVIRAVEIAPTETYDSYDAAVATRDALTELLDEQADVAPDDTYPALVQLRADLVKAVPGDNSDLARLLRYTPGFTVPSLVLAHRLYGNLDLEADLVTRNHIRNPMFVPGGRELEVLSRDA